jgi:hypothetical protein
MNCATLPFTQDIQMVSLVAAIVASIVFFEQVPERSIWCTPVKQEEEHIVHLSNKKLRKMPNRIVLVLGTYYCIQV